MPKLLEDRGLCSTFNNCKHILGLKYCQKVIDLIGRHFLLDLVYEKNQMIEKEASPHSRSNGEMPPL